ncbi:peptidylprolyl isomerase [Shimia sp. Alg240-R146]|uniref:peptidylprolyl isomerase n=1 Tax=Shimia sp. Alg240-R146 TaxID=2993449 RepID=UPI0022E317DE|nr:peptidylprolyl isomerase [Shimia sp. Alg240-R146]
MQFLFRTLREPLLHFLLMGGIIFAGYSVLNPETAETSQAKQIVVSSQEMDRIVSQFEATWRRLPTQDELDHLIDNRVREHILVREATSLSLDQNDTVIRQRLAQKMTFLISSAAGAAVPDEAGLQKYFQDNAETYASSPRISFRQIYVGETVDQPAFTEMLTSLNKGADPTDFGVRSMLPPAYELSGPNAVNGNFGPAVFEVLLALEPGTWQGPIKSGFGYHAIEVTQVQLGEIPKFDDVKDTVMKDYQATETKIATDNILEELQARYEVILPDQTAREAALQ